MMPTKCPGPPLSARGECRLFMSISGRAGVGFGHDGSEPHAGDCNGVIVSEIAVIRHRSRRPVSRPCAAVPRRRSLASVRSPDWCPRVRASLLAWLPCMSKSRSARRGLIRPLTSYSPMSASTYPGHAHTSVGRLQALLLLSPAPNPTRSPRGRRDGDPGRVSGDRLSSRLP